MDIKKVLQDYISYQWIEEFITDEQKDAMLKNLGVYVKGMIPQLTIHSVVDSLTDKEKIDYEIAQKRKESDDNMRGWLYAIFFGLVIIIVGLNILKSCSS